METIPVGHSDPSSTAEVYTDVAALKLHGEVAKLPVLGVAADAQIRGFRGVFAELIQMAQVFSDQQKAPSDEGANTGGRHRTRSGDTGFVNQACEYLGLVGGIAGDAQIESAKLAADVLGRAEADALRGGLDGPPSPLRAARRSEQRGGEGLPEGGAVGAGGRGRGLENFVRGEGNEKGAALAGAANAPRETPEGGA